MTDEYVHVFLWRVIRRLILIGVFFFLLGYFFGG